MIIVGELHHQVSPPLLRKSLGESVTINYSRRNAHLYFNMMPGDAMGLWIKGDGSGALLNIQIRSPREYHGCISDHYI